MKNILVIDDHKEMRETTIDFLSMMIDQEISVDEAHDAKEALELIERNNYDLILSDQNMPDISGVELAQVLSKSGKFKTDKFLIITGADVEQLKGNINLKVEVFDKALLLDKVIPRINELLIGS